jgi:hypothetical protein
MLLDNIDWKERIYFPHFSNTIPTLFVKKKYKKNKVHSSFMERLAVVQGLFTESSAVMRGVRVTELTKLLPHILNLASSWHPPHFAPQSGYLNTFIFLQDISCGILHMHIYFKRWQSSNSCMCLNLLPIQKTKSRIYAFKCSLATQIMYCTIAYNIFKTFKKKAGLWV